MTKEKLRDHVFAAAQHALNAKQSLGEGNRLRHALRALDELGIVCSAYVESLPDEPMPAAEFDALVREEP